MRIDTRRFRSGSSAFVAALAVIGICFVTNVLAQRHFHRWDWTGSRMNSLSDKTEKLLAGLQDDVEVVVLLQPDGPIYEEVRQLLDMYRSKSSHLQLEYLDPVRTPARVGQVLQRLGIDPRGDSTAVVFSCADRHKHVALPEMVEYDMSEAGLGGGAPRIKAFKGEIAFTSAILSVTQARQKSVLLLRGHGEAALDDPGPRGLSGLAESLKRENMKVEPTEALGRSPLPEGTDLLVIAGPQQGLTPSEAEALGRFLDAGGRLLALLDPNFSRDGLLQPVGIERTLADRGIALGQDNVRDPSQKLIFGGDESFAASNYPVHEITEGLGDSYVVVSLARSVAPIRPAPSGWTVNSLILTTEAGWGEKDLANLRAASVGPGDLPGPVSIGVAAWKDLPAKRSARAVVLGDSDLARNMFLGGGAANLDFLMNAVNWLVGSEEQIGIAAREPEQIRLAMTGPQERMVLLVTLLGLPAFAIASGLVVWLFRRR